MKKPLILFIMLLAAAVALVPNPTTRQASADDFIDMNLANVVPAARNVFRRAEQFWESKIVGYSRNLPFNVRTQLTGRFTINASTEIVDGAGGILGFVDPTQMVTAGAVFNAGMRDRPLAVTQFNVPISSPIVVDIADIGRQDTFETIVHEMGHALGIGTLWTTNGLIDPADPTWRQGLLQTKPSVAPTSPIALQYVGQHGLQGFRRDSGHHRANYVPTDQASLGHWAPDNWFFAPRNGSKTEMMSPFAGPNVFTSLATINGLADMGWDVKGLNEASGVGGGGSLVRVPGIPGFPKRGLQFRMSAVPEPSSAIMLVVGLGGLMVRRRRKA